MKIVALLLILCAIVHIPASFLYAENIPEDQLRYTGINDSSLEKEAASLGIPSDSTVKYVSGMKNLNQNYQNGDLTWTEYIMEKRNFIEDLK